MTSFFQHRITKSHILNKTHYLKWPKHRGFNLRACILGQNECTMLECIRKPILELLKIDKTQTFYIKMSLHTETQQSFLCSMADI